MIRFKGVHIAKVDEVYPAAESTVMHHERGTMADGLVMDARTSIGHEWHGPLPPAKDPISILQSVDQSRRITIFIQFNMSPDLPY